MASKHSPKNLSARHFVPLSHIHHKPKQVEPKVVSPPQSNAVILILISRNLQFLEPISVSLGGSLYMHGVTRLLKSFKSTNRFALPFYGEFNWKDGQMRLLCSLCSVMFIYLRKIVSTQVRQNDFNVRSVSESTRIVQAKRLTSNHIKRSRFEILTLRPHSRLIRTNS